MGRRGKRSGARILRAPCAGIGLISLLHRAPQMRVVTLARTCLLLLLLATALGAGTAYASNYVYDANGRLIDSGDR